MDLTGKIIAVLPAQSGVSQRTGNGWMNQSFVIETSGQYPKRCMFRVQGEARISQFNLQLGEMVTIQFDVDAHEYNGKWYNEITCFNVLRQGQQVQQPMQQQVAAPQPMVNNAPFSPQGGMGVVQQQGLPFPPAQ